MAFRSPGFGGLGFGVWIWVSGFRGVWGLVLHRRIRWFARGLLARRRVLRFGVLVLGSSELGVSFVLCFIFRAVGFRVLCWVLGSS